MIVGFNFLTHSHCTSYIATQYITNYIINKHYIICWTKQLLLLSWKLLMIWDNSFLCLNYLRTCWIFKNRSFIKIKLQSIITQQYIQHLICPVIKMSYIYKQIIVSSCCMQLVIVIIVQCLNNYIDKPLGNLKINTRNKLNPHFNHTMQDYILIMHLTQFL